MNEVGCSVVLLHRAAVYKVVYMEQVGCLLLCCTVQQ